MLNGVMRLFIATDAIQVVLSKQADWGATLGIRLVSTDVPTVRSGSHFGVY